MEGLDSGMYGPAQGGIQRIPRAHGAHDPSRVADPESSRANGHRGLRWPGASDFRQKLAKSREPFDKWFRDHVSEYHGVDFSKIAKAEPPEMVMDWYVPSYAEVSE